VYGPALLVLAVALALAGCSGKGERGDAHASASASARPALCGDVRASVRGRVRAAAAAELSGLAVSRSQAGVLWTHNDSGDSPRVLAITTRGRLLAELAVPGADNYDWEDLAVGRGPGGRQHLYVSDTGDNDAVRSAVEVYRVAEPRARGGAGATAPAQRIGLRYPDGPHDAEALIVTGSRGAVTVVTKSYGGVAGVYTAARPRAGATTTLRRAGRVDLGEGEAVTGASLSANGRVLALRSYFRAFVWRRRSGEPVAATLRRRPCRPDADLLAEGQGEAIALSRDGRAFYTVPEGALPPVRRYVPAR
jgi:hypothetical protein